MSMEHVWHTFPRHSLLREQEVRAEPSLRCASATPPIPPIAHLQLYRRESRRKSLWQRAHNPGSRGTGLGTGVSMPSVFCHRASFSLRERRGQLWICLGSGALLWAKGFGSPCPCVESPGLSPQQLQQPLLHVADELLLPCLLGAARGLPLQSLPLRPLQRRCPALAVLPGPGAGQWDMVPLSPRWSSLHPSMHADKPPAAGSSLTPSLPPFFSLLLPIHPQALSPSAQPPSHLPPIGFPTLHPSFSMPIPLAACPPTHPSTYPRFIPLSLHPPSHLHPFILK